MDDNSTSFINDILFQVADILCSHESAVTDATYDSYELSEMSIQDKKINFTITFIGLRIRKCIYSLRLTSDGIPLYEACRRKSFKNIAGENRIMAENAAEDEAQLETVFTADLDTCSFRAVLDTMKGTVGLEQPQQKEENYGK